LVPQDYGARPSLPYGPQRKPAGVSAKIKGNLAGGTSVLVGALRGSLYALPADHIMLDALAPAPAALPPPEGRKCTECAPRPWPGALGPLTPLGPGAGVSSGDEDTDSGAGGDTLEDGGGECRAEDYGALVVQDEDASRARSLVPLEPSDEGVAEGLGGLVCPHLPLGLYQLSDWGEGAPALPWLPDAGQPAGKVGNNAVVPGAGASGTGMQRQQHCKCCILIRCMHAIACLALCSGQVP
jgi:serine/threonine-protein kinase/endoribonuclease IRE1